jgi:hypothetical protein
MTTIEYIEKYKINPESFKNSENCFEYHHHTSLFKKFKLILGNNIFLWFLPVDVDRHKQAYEFID